MRFSSTPVALLTGLWLTATSVMGQTAGNRPAGALAATMQLRVLPTNPAGQPASETQAAGTLRQALALRPDDELRPLRTETDELGGHHLRYQQYYRGVKVEHGVVTAHASGGALKTVSGAWTLPSSALNVHPALSEALALKRALASVGARKYMWQDPAEEANLRQQTNSLTATYRPTGELVVVEDFRQPAQGAAARPMVLAWKFNVYAQQPMSRALIYVDAHTGDVVLRDNIIKHLNATGTFATRYSGSKPGIADQFGGGFRLRETTRGKGVTTLNCRRGTSFAAAVDFVDNDNNWTAAEYDNFNFDNAALDAHLGAEATQDYWVSQHGRDSYDDRGTVLLSYVHFDQSFENAFWNGTAMVYGDGASRFRPLTAVDVCGHEIGHAVCETTAALVYRNESGALNEGFSDIWGACVEYHFDPTKQTWLVGEDIDRVDPSLRSMSDPNAEQQPDTYLGDFWDLQQEVHTNSGVLNFWFYLLSVGGTGTNDNGTTYNVNGINITKAGRIAYRAERLYLTPNATYADARQATLQSAVDLFGLGSAEVVATAQAWRAVGLDAATPTLTSMTPTSGPIGTLVTLRGLNLGTTYRVTFNGVPVQQATMTSATALSVIVPLGATTGPVVITTTTGTATSAGVFTVTGNPAAAPSVLSYSPAAGAPQNNVVTLTGTNFTGTTAVLFNGVAAVFTVVSPTQITVTVPSTATSGPLTVTTANGTATAPTPFMVLPFIGALTPTSGIVGTSVAITGTSLSDALSVKFNNTYAIFSVVSGNRLNTSVPIGATTGVVTVRTPSGTATSPMPFVVTPSLAITDFDPTQGNPLTTIVTIRGMGFTGATAVRFNTTPATTFTVASDTELWATVPAGATTGRITVVSPLGTVTSTSLFNVIIPGAPLITSFTPMLGAVGTPVTITGTDLTNATSVKFNGTPATIIQNTPTDIFVTVPVGATTGQITVTTALGTGASALPFHVTVPPTNDSCSSANLPVLVCGAPALVGTTIGATATGDPVASCGTSIDAPGVFYRLVGTGSVTTVFTCGNLTNYDSKLHIFTGSCASLTCITGDDDGCSGSTSSSVTFLATAGTDYLVFVSGWGGNVGDFSVEASCGTTSPVPTISSFTPTSGPVGTGVIISGTNLSNATAVRFNGVAATVLSNTATALATAVPVGATTGPISIVTLGGTATSLNVFTVTASAPIVTTFSPARGPVGTVVTVIGTNLTGSTVVKIGTTNVTTFTPNPVGNRLTITVPPGAGYGQISVTTPGGTAVSPGSFCTEYTPTVTGASRCGSGTLTLTASGAPASGLRYQWYTSATGAPIAGAVGPTFTTPVLSATTTYYVAIAPATACVGTRRAVVATVSAAPTVALTASGPTTLCQGSNVTLTATGAATYRWSTGATTPSITVSTAGTYSVVGTSAGGCPAAAVNRVVTVSALPAAPTATPANRCGPGRVTLTAAGAPAGGSYRWYTTATGGTALTGTAATFTTPSLSANTTYFVSTVAAAGCESATRTAVVATIRSSPTALITVTGSTTLCPGDSAMLTATGGTTYRWSTGATTATIYVPRGQYTVDVTNVEGCTTTSATVIVVERPNPQPVITAAPQASGIVILTSSAATGNQWYFNGGPIVGATGPTYTVSTSTQSGLYTVVNFDPFTGCRSLMSLTMPVTVTGTAAELTAAAWALWPNPAGQEVRSTGLAPGTALSLFDATGRLVRTTHADAAGAAMLDVAALPRGVYAVRLTGGATKRLVLE